MRLLITQSIAHEVEIDPDLYIGEYPEDFQEFLDGDEPTQELKEEFVVEQAYLWFGDMIDESVNGCKLIDRDSDLIDIERLKWKENK